MKLLDLLCAQPIDIEGRAADEVLELFDRLGRADDAASAPPDRIAIFANGVTAAFRT